MCIQTNNNFSDIMSFWNYEICCVQCKNIHIVFPLKSQNQSILQNHDQNVDPIYSMAQKVVNAQLATLNFDDAIRPVWVYLWNAKKKDWS
jgi:diaminopimelate epimerase